MKNKETLEEAAQIKYPVNHSLPIMDKIGLNYASHQGFIEGAKWQIDKQDVSYSEEEVEYLLYSFKNYLGFGEEVNEKEWFEQFKKK